MENAKYEAEQPKLKQEKQIKDRKSKSKVENSTLKQETPKCKVGKAELKV